MPRSCLAKYQQSTEHFQSNYRASSKQSPSNYLAKAKQIPRKYQANSEGKSQRSWGRIWPFWDHFWRLLGSRKLPKSEFERERLSLRFLVAFEGSFGPVLGAMLRQSGPHEVCFFRVLYHPKSISFSKVVFRAVGTLFGLNWGPFLMIFRSQNRGQRRPRQRCQNCVFVSARIKFSMFGRH